MTNLLMILICGATLASAMAELTGHAGSMTALTESMIKAAEDAIQLTLTLAASMAVFMGLLKVAERGQILVVLAEPLKPLLLRLFPRTPEAVDAISLNVSANLLGLGNAATPFGLKAMEMLEKANPNKGIASDAEIMFLALNTAGITLLPTKVIALRASLGSSDPTAIIAPTLIASLCAALGAVAATWWLSDKSHVPKIPTPLFAVLPVAMIIGLGAIMMTYGTTIGPWIVPIFFMGILLWGWKRGIPLYETIVEGARDGLLITWRICPYLMTIMVAIAMARQSGALEMILTPLSKLLSPVGLPPDALLMAVVRSLSGSGAFGLLSASLAQPVSGPDTPLGILLSTIYGSTETTFYVIAVYFGAIGTHSLRHAILIGLCADCIGLLAATLLCSWMYGPYG